MDRHHPSLRLPRTVTFAVALLGAFAAALFAIHIVAAFTGPTQAPPSGNGVISVSGTNVGVAGNVTVGTSGSDYGVEILPNVSGNSIFWLDDYNNTLRFSNGTTPGAYPMTYSNGGNLAVPGTISGSYTGTMSAGNLSAGSFGANTGGGNYSFPANVGIGVAGPTQALEVNGAIQADNGNSLSATSGNTTGSGGYSSVIINSTGNNTNSGYVKIQAFYAGIGYTTPLALQPSGGNVGIGTATPGNTLTVAGKIQSTSGGVVFPDGTVQTTAASASGQTTSAANVSSGSFGANTGGGNYTFPGSITVGPSANYLNTNGSLICFSSAGTCASGVASPSIVEDWGVNLVGNGGTQPVRVTDAALLVGYGNFSTSYPAGNLLVSGNVGIGTVSPGDSLDVSGQVVFGASVARLSIGSDSIGFNRRVATGAIYSSGEYAYQFEHNGNAVQGSDNLAIQVYNPSGGNITSNALAVNGYGDVGVNTATPVTALSVAGAITINEGTTFGGVNGYSFIGDGGYDTGMFSPSDGIVDFYNNTIHSIDITPSAMTVYQPTTFTQSATFSGNANVSGILYVSTPGGMWLSGMNGTNGIDAATPQSASSYTPILRQTTASGNVVALGGLGDGFGFLTYNSGRTANGYDYAPLYFTTNNGEVGIDTTAPGYTLDVSGTGRFTSTLYANGGVALSPNAELDYWGGGTPYRTWMDNNSTYFYGAVQDYAQHFTMDAEDLGRGWTWGAFGAAPGASLDVNGNLTLRGGLTAGGNLSVGANKITAGTIDPIYTISGTNYATYVPGMTGQKEETAGTLTLARQSDGTYAAPIDLGSATKGSDLWLFAQATDMKAPGAIDGLIVALTPGFDGRVWYTKDAAAETFTIHGTAAGEVSYSLTAPRFDAAQWTNLAPSQDAGAKGFVIGAGN